MHLVNPAIDGEPWRFDYWRVGPSKHLFWAELDCNDGTAYPYEWRLSESIALAKEFEFIRATLGDLPIKVSSGYRTPSWNKKVGGSRTSQHIFGRALDLYPPRTKMLPELLDAAILVAHRRGGRIRGIGHYRTFIHIDLRPGDRVCRWRGNRVRPELSRVA